MVLRSSPSATDSCNGLSMLPSLLKGMALVLLTGEGVERSLGSLAGMGLSALRTKEVLLKVRTAAAEWVPVQLRRQLRVRRAGSIVRGV
ncbi:hypothetical protein KCU73_g70, partial [Aureobasidium melanogenum]